MNNILFFIVTKNIYDKNFNNIILRNVAMLYFRFIECQECHNVFPIHQQCLKNSIHDYLSHQREEHADMINLYEENNNINLIHTIQINEENFCTHCDNQLLQKIINNGFLIESLPLCHQYCSSCKKQQNI